MKITLSIIVFLFFCLISLIAFAYCVSHPKATENQKNCWFVLILLNLAALAILLFTGCGSARNIPANLPPIVTRIKANGNTNDYKPHSTSIELSWVLSKSPNIVTQRFLGTFTIQPKWFFVEGLSNWVTNVFVSTTNYAQEYFGIQAVNSNGIASALR